MTYRKKKETAENIMFTYKNNILLYTYDIG